MPIKPIDLQVQIPKSTEVSRIHGEEIQRHQTAQQFQATSNQQAAADNLKRVYSQNRAHNVKISEKQKEKESRYKTKDQKQQKEKESSPQLLVEPEPKSIIDIKI